MPRRPARARRSSTRPSARAATPRCSPPTCRGRGKLIAIDRDPTARAVLRALRAGTRGVQTRLLRGDFGVVLRSSPTTASRADAILLDLGVSSHAARPARARLLVRDRRAARHADGPVAGARPRATLVNEWPERELVTDLPPLRRGALREADRARDRRAAGAEQPFERTGELVDTIKGCDPRAGAVRRRSSGEARLPGAPHRGQRRARLARGGAAGGARDAAARRPARRHLLPLARGPDRQALPSREGAAAARARPTSRSACAATSPSCARSSAGRSGPGAGRGRGESRARRRRGSAQR